MKIIFIWGLHVLFWFTSDQIRSVAQSCLTLCNPMNRSTPGLPVHHQLPEFTQTHVHQVSDAIHPSHPLASPSPPAPNPSQHQSLFQWVNYLLRWPKYWSFSFSIIPSKEIPGLISFRMDGLDLLAVQGTLKSLLQHHSSILRHSAFFTVQHPYMTTGKTIDLTRRTFVGKVMMSLLLNMLSRLVIAFLPRSKRLLISWLQAPSAVNLEPKKWSLTLFPLFSHLFPMKWWEQMPWSSFSECWALSQLFHSPLSKYIITDLHFSRKPFHSSHPVPWLPCHSRQHF